jgi:hypothetical protein
MHHINIRYFFIKDKIEKEEISIVHCPTEDMIADYFTKPLQGEQFTRFRDIIMGIVDDMSEERVGMGVTVHDTTHTGIMRNGHDQPGNDTTHAGVMKNVGEQSRIAEKKEKAIRFSEAIK